MNRRHAGSAGQTLIIFALTFALVLFGLTCVVTDTAALEQWSGRVSAAAQVAAESGADSVDPGYLYGGSCGHPGCERVIVDISTEDRQDGMYAFERACVQSGDQSADIPRDPPDDTSAKTASDPQTPSGTACDSNGCRVFAEVTRVVDLPLALPGFPSSVTVHGTAYAAPVVGTTQPLGMCTGAGWVPRTPG